MSEGNPYAATLLETSAGGFAGYAASAMLEKAPDLKSRYAPDAFGNWKSHLTQRILELAAAVHTGEPQVFASRILWSRKAFIAHGRNEDDLLASLGALRDVLSEHLPDKANREALDYVDRAVGALSGPPPPADESELDPERPNDRLALRYLQTVLEGNGATAIKDVLAALETGMTPTELYLEVLLPAQREIGRLWHLGDVTVAEEHLVTAATQRAMSVLAVTAKPEVANGKTMVAAAVAGNIHDVGLRAVTDAYEIAGWRTIYLGSDVPIQDLPANLTYFEADLLLVSATLSTQIPRLSTAIAEIRERCERTVKVLVGGAAFDEAPDVWKKIGADGYAATIDESLRVGAGLVGL